MRWRGDRLQVAQNDLADALCPLGIEVTIVEEIHDAGVQTRGHREIAERRVVAAGEQSGREYVFDQPLGFGNTDVEAPSLQFRWKADLGREKALVNRVQGLLLRIVATLLVWTAVMNDPALWPFAFFK